MANIQIIRNATIPIDIASLMADLPVQDLSKLRDLIVGILAERTRQLIEPYGEPAQQ